MSFSGSVFSNLSMNVTHGLTDMGVRAAFNAAHYAKRDGKLKFISHRGYSSVFVYAAKRTMMQMTFASINDLYPQYVRQLDQSNAKKAYKGNQGQELEKIITNGHKADEETYNKMGIVLNYRGAPANEGLLLWIKNESGQATTLEIQTYWDKIKGLSTNSSGNSASVFENTLIKVPGEPALLDLGAIVQAQSSNNLILTKVQGRDYSRKELISGGDISFTVTGKIVSNYPDVYPYSEVSKFVTLMQHKGCIQVFNIMFQQFNVTQILVKDFQMGQNQGFKNEQPYSFTCVAVEPDDAVQVVEDTINATNLEIAQTSKSGWAKLLLDQVKSAAANQAAQMVTSLTSKVI